jgi:hypothetical protein
MIFWKCCRLGIGLLTAVCGILGIVTATLQIRTERRAQDWLPVSAIIEKVGINSHTEGKSGYVYCPLWTYRYEVDGISYDGNSIYAGDTGIGASQVSCPWSEAETKRKLAVSPPGSNVTAFYDPSNPSMATLIINHNERVSEITKIILGILAIGFGTAMFLGI